MPQAHTFRGERGDTPLSKRRFGVHGHHMEYRDLYEAVLQTIRDTFPEIVQMIDEDAFAMAVCCELERVAGIFPNLPRSDDVSEQHRDMVQDEGATPSTRDAIQMGMMKNAAAHMRIHHPVGHPRHTFWKRLASLIDHAAGYVGTPVQAAPMHQMAKRIAGAYIASGLNPNDLTEPVRQQSEGDRYIGKTFDEVLDMDNVRFTGNNPPPPCGNLKVHSGHLYDGGAAKGERAWCSGNISETTSYDDKESGVKNPFRVAEIRQALNAPTYVRIEHAERGVIAAGYVVPDFTEPQRAWPNDGDELAPSFALHGTKTGRFSSDDVEVEFQITKAGGQEGWSGKARMGGGMITLPEGTKIANGDKLTFESGLEFTVGDPLRLLQAGDTMTIELPLPLVDEPTPEDYDEGRVKHDIVGENFIADFKTEDDVPTVADYADAEGAHRRRVENFLGIYGPDGMGADPRKKFGPILHEVPVLRTLRDPNIKLQLRADGVVTWKLVDDA